MQQALAEDDQGRERLDRQNAKEDDYLTRVMEKRCGQEDAERRALDTKKARTMDETGSKRTQEGEEEEPLENNKRHKPSESSGSKRDGDEPTEPPGDKGRGRVGRTWRCPGWRRRCRRT